jgi:hypothetical protein
MAGHAAAEIAGDFAGAINPQLLIEGHIARIEIS